jgi:hypothetical protein
MFGSPHHGATGHGTTDGACADSDDGPLFLRYPTSATGKPLLRTSG